MPSGIELHFLIVLEAMQAVEVRSAVNAKQHSLAANDKWANAVAQRGLDDQRKTVAPVIAVSGGQPHALTLALNDQAIRR